MTRAWLAIALCSTGCYTAVRARPTAAFPESWAEVERLRAEGASLHPHRAKPVDPGLLAVLPFATASGDVPVADRDLLEELVRVLAGEHFQARDLTVLTGETTLSVLTDNGVNPGLACEASCALAAARELKARIFVSGVVARSEGNLLAFVRLFDSESGRQLAALKLEGPSLKAVRDAFEKGAPRFFGRVDQDDLGALASRELP